METVATPVNERIRLHGMAPSVSHAFTNELFTFQLSVFVRC